MRKTLLTAGLALAGVLAGTGMANAAALPTASAVTVLTDRPDSGGGPYPWAADQLTRLIKLTQGACEEGWCSYTAELTDTGSATTIPGRYTPNQGAPFTGSVITGKITLAVNGNAEYSFRADRAPNAGDNAGVPYHERGMPAPDSPQTTSYWFEQMFPKGTCFAGEGITTWSWDYRYAGYPYQEWTDAWDNGGGQLPGDGNITG